jgi:hypothetical protein
MFWKRMASEAHGETVGFAPHRHVGKAEKLLLAGRTVSEMRQKPRNNRVRASRRFALIGPGD